MNTNNLHINMITSGTAKSSVWRMSCVLSVDGCLRANRRCRVSASSCPGSASGCLPTDGGAGARIRVNRDASKQARQVCFSKGQIWFPPLESIKASTKPCIVDRISTRSNLELPTSSLVSVAGQNSLRNISSSYAKKQNVKHDQREREGERLCQCLVHVITLPNWLRLK